MRNKILSLSALVLIIMSCAFLSAQAENATLKSDAALNLFPYFRTSRFKTLIKNTKIEVLDEREEWYLTAANGYTGYVKKSAINMRGEMTGGLSLKGDAPVITVTGFDIPAYFPLYRTVSLKGDITSTMPITRVRVYYYYDRWMYEEAGVYQDFELSQNVLSFNLDKLLRTMPAKIENLLSGEMRLCVDVSGEFGTVRAAEIPFYITGKCKDPLSMTEYCDIFDEGGMRIENVTNNDLDDGWVQSSDDGFIDVLIPDDRKPEGLTLKWFKPPTDYTIKQYDENGSEIDTLESDNESELWNTYTELDARTKRVTIASSVNSQVCELRVYEQGFVPSVVQKWEPMPEDMDLLLVTGHKNDETLYFSGTLPMCFSRDINAGVIVLTECGTRHGQEEFFENMWLFGSKWQPIVLRLFDKRTSMDREEPLLELWGGYEPVCEKITALVRRYKPEVMLTHDIKGEFGHAAHKLAFKFTYDSVLRASDETMYADSYEQYGAWSVSKMYSHLYDKANRLNLPFNEPLEMYGGRTAMDMAYAAFNKYQSELGNKYYSLDMDGKTYDKTCFGLYYTTVGPDVLKNDFFENIG